jgi:septal ring factor EnvC (AmiA/AmiB activator)
LERELTVRTEELYNIANAEETLLRELSTLRRSIQELSISQESVEDFQSKLDLDIEKDMSELNSIQDEIQALTQTVDNEESKLEDLEFDYRRKFGEYDLNNKRLICNYIINKNQLIQKIVN